MPLHRPLAPGLRGLPEQRAGPRRRAPGRPGRDRGQRARQDPARDAQGVCGEAGRGEWEMIWGSFIRV